MMNAPFNLKVKIDTWSDLDDNLLSSLIPSQSLNFTRT